MTHQTTDGDTDGPDRFDRPALLRATPDTEVVLDRLRTLAVLVGVLGLLVALIAAELLVRI